MKGGKSFAHSLNKKELWFVTSRVKTRKTNDHSRGMIEPKCVAPAALQRAASPLILATTTIGMVETLRKTLALRSFQISQEVSMMSDAKDFHLVPLTNMKLSHQSSTVTKLGQLEVSTEMIPNQESKEFQILQE